MDLEAVAKELKMLASKERLTPLELDRAKHLMVELKKMGMTNPEIAELMGGRWSESAIKGYTRGVKATDPEPWKSTAVLFSEMQSKNLTLANVSEAMTIKEELESMGASLGDMVNLMRDLKERGVTLSQLGEAINIDADLKAKGTSTTDIASFVAELEEEKVGVRDFILLFREWHEAGLTPVGARSVLGYKAQLEEAGIDIDILSHIAEATKKLGTPAQVLEAIAKYGDLKELDKEAQAKRKELATMATEMASCSQKLQEVQDKTVAIQEALATYRRLEGIGFNEKALGELAKAAENYGTPGKVLRAVIRFGNLSNLKATDDELRNKVKQKRQMVKSLDEQYQHLKEPIEMCKTLLKRRFGLSVLSLINRTALKYGEPTEILKAIEAYGQLKEIEKKTKEANSELVEIRSKIQRLEEVETKYNARNKVILDQFEALNAKAIEVGRLAGSVQEQLKGDTMARGLLLLLHNPSSVSYENSFPLVIVLLKAIIIWSITNKSKLRYASTIQRNLEEVSGSLGGS